MCDAGCMRSHFHILYSDIGGVLGTNGWDGEVRRKVAERFGLDLTEIEPRHHLMFDSYERGYLRFDDYLRYVFFASPREFTLDELRETLASHHREIRQKKSRARATSRG